MKNKYLIWTKNLVEILLVAGLFVLSAYLVQTNLDFFQKIIGERLILGMLVFIFVEIMSIVFAPVTTIPLLPVASNVWGGLLQGF